jgi:hypothetical protein
MLNDTDERTPDVRHAFQALGLDEHRNAFTPTLWYLPKFGNVTSEQIEAQKSAVEKKAQEWEELLQNAIKLKESRKASDEDINGAARHLNMTARALNEESRKLTKLEDDRRHQVHPRTLRQVWFPGYHINIGGGSDDTLHNEGDMEEMSSITFAWMLDQIKPYLSLNEEYLGKERADMEFHISTLVEKPQLRESLLVQAQRTAAVFKRSSLATVESGDKQRSYGWGTGVLKDSFTPFYYLNGSKKRTPGSYDPLDKDGQPLGDTFEYVHPVVGFREKQLPEYTPIGHGVKFNRRKIVDEKGRPSVVYDLGNARKPLPEWPLGGLDSYERLAITGKAAYDYVDELDVYLRTGIKTPRRSVWGIPDIDIGVESAKVATPNPPDVGQDGFEAEVIQEEFESKGFESKGVKWSTSEVSYSKTVIRG